MNASTTHAAGYFSSLKTFCLNQSADAEQAMNDSYNFLALASIKNDCPIANEFLATYWDIQDAAFEAAGIAR